MEEENKNKIETYFLQLKDCISSENEIYNILTNDNIQENNKEWSNNLFHCIEKEWIMEWKSFIDFNNICKELKNKKKNIIEDEDKEWLLPLIEKNIKNKSIKDFDNSSIYGSLLNFDINSSNPIIHLEEDNINIDNKYDSVNTEQNISPYSDFNLISTKAWESFNKKKENNEEIFEGKKEFSGEIYIKIGKKKIIVKINDNQFIVLYFKKDKLNKDNIQTFNLEKELNQIIINIENVENDSNEFIKKLINLDFINWLKEINYNENNKNYKYDNNILYIIKKDKNKIFYNYSNNNSSLNCSNIPLRSTQFLSQNNNIKNYFNKIRSIKDIKYINKIIIKNVHNFSNVIASMYSLSQILEFADYFFSNKNNELFLKSQLFLDFKDFIDELWTNKKNNQIFIPKKFIKSLIDSNRKLFPQKEQEPIIFLKEIFKIINNELNNKDSNIKKKMIDLINENIKLKNFDKNFINYYYNIFLPNYNSIVSKVFYGIFHYNYLCNSCGEIINQEFKDFQYIELDINSYENYKSKLDDSLINIYLDEIIEFYFNQKISSLKQKCRKCQNTNENKIENKIYIFPKIIIFYINWGKFDSGKGFIALEDNKLIFDEIIDLTKYSFYKGEIKYKIRSIINYPIINENNEDDSMPKKFVTFNRHIVDEKFYCYQPSGEMVEIHNFNRKKFIPSVLFYEKE